MKKLVEYPNVTISNLKKTDNYSTIFGKIKPGWLNASVARLTLNSISAITVNQLFIAGAFFFFHSFNANICQRSQTKKVLRKKNRKTFSRTSKLSSIFFRWRMAAEAFSFSFPLRLFFSWTIFLDEKGSCSNQCNWLYKVFTSAAILD